MDAITIERWIKSLGRYYDELIAQKIIPDLPLQELYPGRDLLDMMIAPGLSMSFGARSRQFETLFITLLKTTPSTAAYTGALPSPFVSVMRQVDVRAYFGEPLATRGPVKMPQPMGMTGGWDAYLFRPQTYSNTKVVFQYTSVFEVNTLVFSRISSDLK